MHALSDWMENIVEEPEIYVGRWRDIICETTKTKQLKADLLEDIFHVMTVQARDTHLLNTTSDHFHDIPFTSTEWTPNTVERFERQLKKGTMNFHIPLPRTMAEADWKKWYRRALAPLTLKDLRTIVVEESFSPRSGKRLEPAYLGQGLISPAYIDILVDHAMGQNHGDILVEARQIAAGKRVSVNFEVISKSYAVSVRFRELLSQIRKQDEDVQCRCSSFCAMFLGRVLMGDSNAQESPGFHFPFSVTRFDASRWNMSVAELNSLRVYTGSQELCRFFSF